LLEIIFAVDRFLEEDEQNVVVIHCIAGKGRTGTVIACYLLYKSFYTAPEEALGTSIYFYP